MKDTGKASVSQKLTGVMTQKHKRLPPNNSIGAESHLSLSLPRVFSFPPGVSLVTLSQRAAPAIDPPTGDD